MRAAIVAASTLISTPSEAKDTVPSNPIHHAEKSIPLPKARPLVKENPTNHISKPTPLPKARPFIKEHSSSDKTLALDDRRRAAFGNDEETVKLLEEFKRQGMGDLVNRVMIHNHGIAASQPKVSEWLLDNYVSLGLYKKNSVAVYVSRLLDHSPNIRHHIEQFQKVEQLRTDLRYYLRYDMNPTVLVREFSDFDKFPWARDSFSNMLYSKMKEVVAAVGPESPKYFQDELQKQIKGQPWNLVMHYPQLKHLFSEQDLINAIPLASGPSIYSLLQTKDEKGKDVLSLNAMIRIKDMSKLSRDKSLLELGVTFSDYKRRSSRDWGGHPSFMRTEFAYSGIPQDIDWGRFKKLSRPINDPVTFWKSVEDHSKVKADDATGNQLQAFRMLGEAQGVDPFALTQGVWTAYRYMKERSMSGDLYNIDRAVNDISSQREQRQSLDHFAPGRRIVVVAANEQIKEGQARFGTDALVQKIGERTKARPEFFRADPGVSLKDTKSNALDSLGSADARPLTWMVEAHGISYGKGSKVNGMYLSGGESGGAEEGHISPRDIADQLAKRYSNPGVLRAVQSTPDVLIFGSCFGADIRDEIYALLSAKGLPLPDVTTMSDRNLLGWSDPQNKYGSTFNELLVTSPSVKYMIERFSSPFLDGRPTYTIQDPKKDFPGQKPRLMQLGGIEPAHIETTATV